MRERSRIFDWLPVLALMLFPACAFAELETPPAPPTALDESEFWLDPAPSASKEKTDDLGALEPPAIDMAPMEEPTPVPTPTPKPKKKEEPIPPPPPAPPAAPAQASDDVEVPEVPVNRTDNGDDRYVVVLGDTLWGISGRDSVYGNHFHWPLIFRANRDMITDPDLIYPRQEFSIRRDFSDEEVRKAVRDASATPAYVPHTVPREVLPVDYF